MFGLKVSLVIIIMEQNTQNRPLCSAYTNNPWGISGAQTYSEFRDGLLDTEGDTLTGYGILYISYFLP